MDSGSSAPAPDYVGQAQATAAGNLENLKYQTVANRPTIQTPWGTDTWSTPDANGQQTETVTLTPDTQAALDAQQKVQNNQSQLAAYMQGQVANTMSTPFQAPSMSDYMSSVPGVQSNFAGFSPTGVGGTNQQSFNPSMFTRGNQQVGQNLNTGANNLNQNFTSSAQNVNTDAQGAVAGAGTVNQNTPQFSDATAQAGAQSAYDAAHSLIADQQSQDTTNLDTQLRMQGLMPGTEAYNNAAQNLSRTQAQQNNNLAAQAVQVGNNEANQNYASALAGYNANLGAQNQAYAQGANTFSLGNSALGQHYGQDANTVSLNNAASTQQSQNAINTFNAQNAARTQAQTNSLANYNAALAGQGAYNTAQNQAYNQALAGYGANQTAQAQSNAAQAQQYGQAMQNYNTAYNTAYQNYNTPLNEMNAVLYGNQVQNPNFGSYAQSGYVGGADLTTAAQNQGQYQSAQDAASTASNNGTMGMIGSLAAAAAIAY
jgi:hypothetical protein